MTHNNKAVTRLGIARYRNCRYLLHDPTASLALPKNCATTSVAFQQIVGNSSKEQYHQCGCDHSL